MQIILNTIEDGNNTTLQTKTCIALVNKALEGNTKAFEVIRDTVEGKPMQSTKEENIQDVRVQIIDDLESEIYEKQLKKLLSILSTEELQRLANCEDSDILKLLDEDGNLL